jgi:hypothetical protein
MDFTQIMQRYIRLREKFEQGELDADSFERQVNSMVYKDKEGRYWQIGVQSGQWYYFDGEKWVQDDLDEEIETVDEVSQDTPVGSSQQEEELAAIDEIFPKDADAEFPEDDEPSPFDKAFEEQLASQFAEASDSQTFKLFESEDIFDVILKGKGLEIEDDPLAAPAEEVEGLAEYLEVTQPVSLESMMGEGTAQPIELDESDDAFLFEDSDETEEPSLEDGSQIDFSAVFAGAFPDDEEEAWEEEDVALETDVREVSPKEVVTGELHMPAEPVSEEAIQSLWADVDESDFELEGDDEEDDDDVPLPDLFAEVESHEESTLLTQEEEFMSEVEVETSPTAEDEAEDDEFSLDDLVYASNQDYLEATQQGKPLETFDFSDEEEGTEESEGDDAPFELPVQDEFDQLNTVPAEVSAPAGDTMHSPSKAKRKKRKLPIWMLLLIIFLGVFIVGVAVMVGWNYVQGIQQNPAIVIDSGNLPKQRDERLLVYDNFEDELGAWPSLSDATWGFTGYASGFYYLYSIVPEVPTIVTMDVVYQDIVLEVEMTQLDQNIETLSTYGVMCRVQPNGDGYSFRITNNGQYVIEKYVGGIFYPINGWQYSRVIKANRDVNKNVIEAYCEGNQLRLTVNGHVLDLAIDDTFTEGKIGFVSQAGTSQFATEVHYDDLYLRKP